MISKISKGKGFRGLLMYISQKSSAEYLCGNVAENPHDAAVEMGALRQYSRCKTPVWHCSLSLSPQDRQLSNVEFAALAEKFIVKMGLSANQYCVWRHNDKAHSHIHIVANRICLSEKHEVWNSWQDIKRAREAKTELEHEFNLIETPYNPQFATPDIPRGQREEARRRGVMPSKQYVAEAIASAALTSNIREFVKSLNAQGIQTIPNISQTGRMNGFSFAFGKRHYKGSQLRCSWKELSERIHYSPDQDNEFLLSLLPEEKRPNRIEETRWQEPRRERTIYTSAEWQYMGGEKDSDYKRAYQMITDGYSIRDVAQELRRHNPNIPEKQLRWILYSSGKLWIENNTDKLAWAFNSRRRYIRFSQDPTVMLLQVLALLISAAVKVVIQGIEEHQAERRIYSLSRELMEMRDYAEKKAMQRLHRLERQERERMTERDSLLLAHARERSLERSR